MRLLKGVTLLDKILEYALYFAIEQGEEETRIFRELIKANSDRLTDEELEYLYDLGTKLSVNLSDNHASEGTMGQLNGIVFEARALSFQRS